MSSFIDSLVRPSIGRLKAYHVEPFEARVILDANESPYRLPDKVLESLFIVMAGTEFNRYPDPSAYMLRKMIANKEGVPENGIVFGNGSDEIIQSIIGAFCDPGEKILTLSPTFSMYKQIATYFSVETVEAPLKDDWSVDLQAIKETMAREKPKVTFIASPNSPTGQRYPKETLHAIVESAPGIVVVDEAYVDFSGSPPDEFDSPEVIVLKTFSKIGFAALRLGYMKADPAVANEVEKVRLPYNVNTATQACAVEVLKRWDQIASQFEKTKEERQRVFNALSSIEGVTVYPSEANFHLIRINNDPEKTFRSLLDHSVRVRWFKGDPRLSDFFRVTIGTPAENDAFLKALPKSV